MSFKRTSCGTRSPYRSPSPPSNSDSGGRNPASTHNTSIHCQPSEDADYTVTDLLPSPVIRNPHVLHPRPDRIRQYTALPTSTNFAFPDIYGDTLTECVMTSVANNSGSSELNLRSDLSQSSATAGTTNCEENLEDIFNAQSRKETPHERRPTVDDWTSDEDVDSPGLGARPAGNDEVTMLRRNYNRLLENHQRFVVSNAQLHNIREELLGRVAAQEMELEQARSMIRSLELDKQQLSNEVDSLHKTFLTLKDQMPLLAMEEGQPCQQMINDKRNSADEWTSSLKEELRQTILLAMSQQEQLNGLYRVIKQQNEAIRQLTSKMTSDPKAWPQLPFQDDYRGFLKHSAEPRTPKELELRQNPEGSSVSTQDKVKGQRPVDHDPTPPPEVRLGNVAIPLKDSLKKFFGGTRIGTSPPKHQSTASAAIDNSMSPLTTVAKRQPAVAKQHPSSSGALPPVKTSRSRESLALQEPLDLHSDVDLVNAGFVFVDSSLGDSRICPLCGVGFSSIGTTMEQFVEHVSKCVPPAEHRQCPVCMQKFDKSVTDRMIEMHVNEHFDEDRFQCLSPVENK